MSPWQRKLRRALGTVKDQTTIGLAKVVGVMAPELEVALVKTTSHDKYPFEEKHVQEVIFLTSSSTAYAMACVSLLSRRLARTQNWIVVIKVLMLIHRLLRDSNRAFEEELLRESRAGGHVLDLSGFQDGSITSGWEYSAFVRTYALYLDELLDFNAGNRAFVTEDGTPSSSSNSSFSRRSGSETCGSGNDEQGSGSLCRASFKEMKPKELLERMPPVQRMLERVLACLPAGDARMDRLIQSALALIVKDSFPLYENVCDGLAIILDAFFLMQKPECARAFEIQNVAAKQAEAMDTFYGFCKERGGCRALEYPYVRKIPEQFLETMEVFLQELSMKESMEKQDRSSRELGKPRAIPAPPLTQAVSSPVQVSKAQEPLKKSSLIDVRQKMKSYPTASFTDNDASAWETFGTEIEPQVSGMMLGKERQVNGWELALLSSMDPTPSPPSFKAAMETPPVRAAEDPFVASSSIPPPPYVQMSDMKQQQQLWMLEKQVWEQYQRNGMQGANRHANSHSWQPPPPAISVQQQL